MNKREYEQLLNSDYWKGFSYSLIKERNFTCEDCGAKYPYERNKLQVHHLVYRDISPWSYKPEEMVVLCVECHQKRHGIYKPQEEGHSSGIYTSDTGGYSKSYKNTTDDSANTEGSALKRFWENRKSDQIIPYSLGGLFGFLFAKKRRKVVLAILAFVILMLTALATKDDGSEPVMREGTIELASPDNNKNVTKKPSSFVGKKTETAEEVDLGESEVDDFEPVEVEPVEVEPVAVEPIVAEPVTKKQMEKSTSEILDERLHQNVVKQAKRAGVSTEGSTSEILDRITHANVVKQAKQAGVSAEGSTSEILDRITHANVVKQAKRAGVSAEGSTSEILDRITHANVVQQAKRAGVSTEGSTSEILDRITRKNLENYGH